jgi:hypothetical protein
MRGAPSRSLTVGRHGVKTLDLWSRLTAAQLRYEDQKWAIFLERSER